MNNWYERTHFTRNHFVYRAYDEHGLLLYIGCTLDPDQRWRQHRRKSAWAQYAATFKMVGPFYRADALTYETLAIESEDSFFNATRDQIEAVMANWREARRRLSEVGIPSVAYFDDKASAAEQNAAAEEYTRAKSWMQQDLRDEFPFRTVEDRHRDYLAARAACEQAIA